MIPYFTLWLVLNATETEPPPGRLVVAWGHLRIECDAYRGDTTIGQFQGNVLLTLQSETGQVVLGAQTITVGFGSGQRPQVATAVGGCHLQVDSKEPESQVPVRYLALTADADRVTYYAREGKMTLRCWSSRPSQVHVEADLATSESGPVQHLVATAEEMIYEGSEEKVTLKSPTTVTLTSPDPEGGESTAQFTARKRFEFWLQGMPEDLRQALHAELEKATADSPAEETATGTPE